MQHRLKGPGNTSERNWCSNSALPDAEEFARQGVGERYSRGEKERGQWPQGTRTYGKSREWPEVLF